MQLTKINKKELAEDFVWYDSRGGKHTIKNMKTVHLFCTVNMIWNHALPEQYKTHDYVRYTFGDGHTPEYMLRAVRLMLPALVAREDLNEFQMKRLQMMFDMLFIKPDLLEFKT